MMRCAPLLLAILLAAPAFAADAPADSAGTASEPDLSGVWVLNARASDDPAASVREVARTTRPRRAGDRDEFGERRQDREQPELDKQTAAHAQRMRQRLARLEIFTGGGEFGLTDGLDIPRLLHTDGRTETIWTDQGEARATANWRDGALEVAWTGPGAPLLSRYRLSPDGTQLLVLEQFTPPGGKEPVVVRLVYDRAGGDRSPTGR